MYKNSLIQEYANLNPRQLVQKTVKYRQKYRQKYRTHKI